MSQLPNQKSFHQIINDYFKTVELLGCIKLVLYSLHVRTDPLLLVPQWLGSIPTGPVVV